MYSIMMKRSMPIGQSFCACVYHCDEKKHAHRSVFLHVNVVFGHYNEEKRIHRSVFLRECVCVCLPFILTKRSHRSVFLRVFMRACVRPSWSVLCVPVCRRVFDLHNEDKRAHRSVFLRVRVCVRTRVFVCVCV